ncbi:MAG: DUF4256 domain-containing protein [Sphaerochaetaceae bacterium]|jgi:hypothetical protein|nr:DUF4256 domain-containing protein [Sphaerochaetaceae bacterium]
MDKDSMTDDIVLEVLETRFATHLERHPHIAWTDVRQRLFAQPAKLRAIREMERSGGEPDVIGYDKTSDAYLYVDCSKESPSGRRNLCYDRLARETRKKFPPTQSASEMAGEMGVDILTQDEYRMLQQLGSFDLKTSSWIHTPQPIRDLGGALFCDRRYDTVFVYHNGADSYYGSRGFRAVVRL